MPEQKDIIRDPLATFPDPLAPMPEPLQFRTVERPSSPSLSPIAIDVMTGPTPQQIDTMISNYESATHWRKAADELENDCKQAIIRVVTDFGHPTPGSEHSRSIEGALNTAMVTEVTTLSLEEKKVQELRSFLVIHDKVDLIGKLFAQRIKHELVAGAEDALRTSYFPKKWMLAEVKALFGECLRVNRSSPRVKISMLNPEPKPARKSRAKKQAVQG